MFECLQEHMDVRLYNKCDAERRGYKPHAMTRAAEQLLIELIGQKLCMN